MRASILRSTLVATVLLANIPKTSHACGVERWSVKTGSDADVGSKILSRCLGYNP